MPSPLVGIVVGSESDRPRMQAAVDELDARGITHEFEVRTGSPTQLQNTDAPHATAACAYSSPAPGWRLPCQAFSRRTRICP
jgi:hypothetical protein